VESDTVAPKREIVGLPADGPDPALRKKLALFGQFVGDWKIFGQTLPESKSETLEEGGAHFRWILGGRAIQDVWGPVDSRTKKLVPVGTTLRYYDVALGAWRSTWISPMQHEVRRFIGRKVGPEIVLQEENRGLKTERWIFHDISRSAFKWRAERRLHPGGAWKVVETMRLSRVR
jgi:hypothetical protein